MYNDTRQSVSAQTLVLCAMLAGAVLLPWASAAPAVEEMPATSALLPAGGKQAPARAQQASTSQPATAQRAPHAPKGARVTPEGWFAPPKPWASGPVLPAKVERAFVLTIREPITERTYDVFKQKVLACKEERAQLIVLDMDTWGGSVTAAMDIARTLKADLPDVYTVCLVRTRALSAGAMIALACDEIAVTRLGKLGGCAPVPAETTPQPQPVEREKIESVLRMEFAESAEMNGYPAALAECMVSVRREAWLVRHVRTRELRYVLKKDYRGLVRVPSGVSDVPSSPGADWELVHVIVPAGELLTMHPRLAIEYGFARRRIHMGTSEDRWSGLVKAYHLTADPVVLDDSNWDAVVQAPSRPRNPGPAEAATMLTSFHAP